LPSCRPWLVQALYDCPRKVKGKTHGSPWELPPITAVSAAQHQWGCPGPRPCRPDPGTAPRPLGCPGCAPRLGTGHPARPLPPRTSVGAEAVFLVLIEVGGGGTPAVAVGAPVRGAGVVGGAVEDEGEDAGGPVAVAAVGVEHCGVRRGEDGPGLHGAGQGLQQLLLTFAGAEAVFLVVVVAGGGGTPGQPVRAPLRDAPGIGVALEDEGEVAVGPVGVPVAGLHHCSGAGTAQQQGWGGRHRPPRPARPCPYLSQFPASRTRRRQSGHRPGLPGPGERHGPRARPCRRRGTRPRALWGQAPSEPAPPDELPHPGEGRDPEQASAGSPRMPALVCSRQHAWGTGTPGAAG